MIDLTANDLGRLKKILTLSHNDNEGESIAAFLMAKRLMEKLNISFDGLISPDNPRLLVIRDFDLKRLKKILALATSKNEGESVAAFLMAKRLMDRNGLNFDSLLDFSRFAGAPQSREIRTVVDMEIVSLRKRVARLQAELVEKTVQLERYKDAFDNMIGSAWDMHNPASDPASEQTYLN
ncbi:MAG: DUF2786 domain-containing protein [Rhodospirillales bacterium]|nr:DUF2786 domain-containing protein [Rhodospirillales bacterium]